MKIFRKTNLIFAAVFVALFLLTGLFFAVDWPATDLKTATFKRLTALRTEKKKELINYFKDIYKSADRIRDDEFMHTCFRYLLAGNDDQSGVEFPLDRHFVQYYGDFYDILFVDADGYVFHSIRRESDYQTHLFDGELADTKLVRQLKKSPEKTFVEYEFYPPSGEPAAFFAAPVIENGRPQGWFVLQCAVNQVNTILTSRENMGRSCEVYLVNQARLMLSDSRFIEDSTILKRRVNTNAVREALQGTVGQRLIQDYRGVQVFSTYEKFSLFNTSWIIIAEIDASEVITDHYRSNPAGVQDKMLPYLESATLGSSPPVKRLSKTAQRVDMNEYAKISTGGVLQTYGVASCTAVAILLPGQFAYLAHISPNDMIYRKGFWSTFYKSNARSDFLGELIRRIKYYDVYPYQLLQLEFVIVAPHARGFAYAVEKILGSGMDLKNIRFMYAPRFQGANILVDPQNGLVEVKWYSENAVQWSSNKGVDNLESVYKKIIGGC